MNVISTIRHCLLGSASVPVTPLEPQSRFGDKLLKNLSGLSPKRDCGSKGGKERRQSR